MSQMYQIPLISGNQTFSVDLGSVPFSFRLQYRKTDSPDLGGGWFMDIRNDNTQVSLFGIPMRFNTDLLGQFQFLGWGRLVVKRDSGFQKSEGTFDDMNGTAIKLFWAES